MDLKENAPGRHSVPTNQDWDLLLIMKVPISSRVSCTMMPVLKRITSLEFCCGCACMLQGASMVYIKTITRTILILIPVILIWLIQPMMHLMTWLLIMPMRCSIHISRNIYANSLKMNVQIASLQAPLPLSTS